MRPILIQIGNFSLESYWFFMALGIIIGGIFIFWEAKKRNLDLQKIKCLIIAAIISGFIGARLFYVFLNFSRYQKNPIRIIQFWNGGFSWQGAFITGVSVILLILRNNKKEAGKYLDVMIFGVLLGHSIGRIGCFLHGCCYGILTNVFWAIENPVLGDHLLRHPTQLYEAFGYLLVFLLLYFYSKKTKFKDGSIFFIGTFLHSFVRFIVEYFRYNTDFIYQGNTWSSTLSYAQLMALFIMVISFLILLKIDTKENSC
jgi:phosphatidylglycerol:prolipoprotein diacylglycerol transferase